MDNPGTIGRGKPGTWTTWARESQVYGQPGLAKARYMDNLGYRESQVHGQPGLAKARCMDNLHC